MVLVDRASRDADRAITAEHAVARSAAVAEACRADERRQLRTLHDTVLATLTMVASGAIDGSSHAVRRRASDDLNTVLKPASNAADTEASRVDLWLERAIQEVDLPLRIKTSLQQCTAPADVADAFTGSVLAALQNVAWHSGVNDAAVALHAQNGRIEVEVADTGRGFDP